MPINFECPHCHSTLLVPDAGAGKRSKCPYCKGTIQIPGRLPDWMMPDAPATSSVPDAPAFTMPPVVAPAAPPPVLPRPPAVPAQVPPAPAPVAAPPPASSPPPPAFAFHAEPPAPARSASEPWYYRYCYAMSLILLVLGVAGLAVGVVAWLIIGLVTVLEAADKVAALQAYFIGSILYALYVGFMLVLLLYFFSFVLVFIDAARHVRRLHDLVSRQGRDR